MIPLCDKKVKTILRKNLFFYAKKFVFYDFFMKINLIIGVFYL